MPRHPHRSLLLTACLVALALTACGRGSDDTATADDTVVTTTTVAEPTTTEPPTTTTEPPTPEQEVEAAYLEAVRLYYERLQNPDPSDPTIGEFHTGPSLAQVQRRNREMQKRGQHDELPDGRAPVPEVIDVFLTNSETATVQACLIDNVIVKEGEIIVNDATNSYLVKVEMRFVDGLWKVSIDTTVERFDGPDGCE